MLIHFARRTRARDLLFPESPEQSAYRAEFCVRNIDESRYNDAWETHGRGAAPWISPRDLLAAGDRFEIFLSELVPLDDLSRPIFLMGGTRLRAARSSAAGAYAADLPYGVRSVWYAEFRADSPLDPARAAIARRALGHKPRAAFTIQHEGDPQVRDLGYALAERLAKRHVVALGTRSRLAGSAYRTQRIRPA